MPKTSLHISTGNTGEDLAAAYVVSKGYQLLARNWRYKKCEVDIIASSARTLHFFEVKTRNGLQWAHPEASVSTRKMTKLKEAAEAYLFAYPQWRFLQFNILAITLFPGRLPEYYLIEDVF